MSRLTPALFFISRILGNRVVVWRGAEYRFQTGGRTWRVF